MYVVNKVRSTGDLNLQGITRQEHRPGGPHAHGSYERMTHQCACPLFWTLARMASHFIMMLSSRRCCSTVKGLSNVAAERFRPCLPDPKGPSLYMPHNDGILETKEARISISRNFAPTSYAHALTSVLAPAFEARSCQEKPQSGFVKISTHSHANP